MRKRKITIQELPDYWSYIRFRAEGGARSGYMYYLCDRLSGEERERLMREYNNVEVATMHSHYASEIKHDVLIVFDKCIR